MCANCERLFHPCFLGDANLTFSALLADHREGNLQSFFDVLEIIQELSCPCVTYFAVYIYIYYIVQSFWYHGILYMNLCNI